MKELAQKDIKDLKKLLAEKREEIRTFRFGTAGAAIRNTKARKNLRHDIAQILTELNKRAKVASQTV